MCKLHCYFRDCCIYTSRLTLILSLVNVCVVPGSIWLLNMPSYTWCLPHGAYLDKA